MDTIYALSTSPGKAGVAVIRVSGPQAHEGVSILCGDVPSPRRASVRILRLADGTILDEALVLVFEKGRSFTGEDMAELQVHGGVASVSSVLAALAELEGHRSAEPGEFTRRALENGQLDMSQVEGLADLIDAETEAQRRQAMRVMHGELGQKTENWRKLLIRAAALLEATIDFVDEDVPVDVSPEVIDLVSVVTRELTAEIQGVSTAERIRTGFEVAIVGPPNIGKSTLLNCLAGREAAITSDYAGTTRDIIEVRYDLNGLPVTLLDTAGLRETDDKVEAIGVARAMERAGAADLRVFLVAPGDSPIMDPEAEDIVLVSKSDMHSDAQNGISGKTGFGVQNLINHMSDVFSKRALDVGVATRQRHKEAMERALLGLTNAQQMMQDALEETDLVAEEIRSSVRALDSLIGRVDIEDVLDEIFASFCLGK